MEYSIEHIQVEFNNRASSIFFTLYTGFRNAVSLLDRQRDENVFQQLQAQYSSMLHQHLQAIARELLDKSKGIQDAGQLQESLPYLIQNYTKEFSQKIKGL